MGFVRIPHLGLHIFSDGVSPPEVKAFPAAPVEEVIALLETVLARLRAAADAEKEAPDAAPPTDAG